MVFAGLYPTDTQQYETLRDALEKLQLNDASLHYEPETSTALGFGFRCGFLGLLHMEIVQERLEREFDSRPRHDGAERGVPRLPHRRHDGAASRTRRRCRTPRSIDRIEEPYVKARIMAPAEYIGPIMTLGTERRGVYKNMTYLDTAARRVRLGVPARRDHPRLLRQAEDDQPRVREPRLRDARVPRERSREARHADQRRPGGRVLA